MGTGLPYIMVQHFASLLQNVLADYRVSAVTMDSLQVDPSLSFPLAKTRWFLSTTFWISTPIDDIAPELSFPTTALHFLSAPRIQLLKIYRRVELAEYLLSSKVIHIFVLGGALYGHIKGLSTTESNWTIKVLNNRSYWRYDSIEDWIKIAAVAVITFLKTIIEEISVRPMPSKLRANKYKRKNEIMKSLTHSTSHLSTIAPNVWCRIFRISGDNI